MVWAFNNAVQSLCRALLRPFAEMDPWVALGVVSFLIALLALVSFKFVSNQSRLRSARNRALAHVLELHLYRDDLLGVFSIFGRILLATLVYLRQSLAPLVILLLPLGIFFIHLAAWFECQPLRPGEPALLTVRLDSAHPVLQTSVAVTNSTGLRVEQPAFVSAAENEIVWRLIPQMDLTAGWVEVTVAGTALRKSVTVSPWLKSVSSRRVRGSSWNSLLYCAEPPLPRDCPVAFIELAYPPRHYYLGATDVNWILAIFVISLAFGLVLRHPMRVEF